MLREVADWVKDCLFPYYCAGCGQEGEWWCKNCRSIKPYIKRTDGPVSDITVLFYYQETGVSGKLIKAFKYEFVSDLSQLWSEMIGENDFGFENEFVVMPVPLYIKRKKERGYNQAEIIGRILATVKGLAFADELERCRETEQQAKLNKEERIKNVCGAFRWGAPEKIPKKIILVDDVYTSGATMNECAKVLKAGGAEEVKGFVLGHGGSPS